MINKELEQINKKLQKEILDQLDKKNKEREEMLNDLSFLSSWILDNASDRLKTYAKQYLEILKKYDLEQYLKGNNLKKIQKEAES